jgi:ribonuclease HI
MTKQAAEIVIFTDGACSGNPGRGGYAAIVATPDKVVEHGGGATLTTNNQMELLAIIVALRSVADIDAPVTLYTDSTYVIKGITEWIDGWRRKGWKTANGTPVANRELWEDLSEAVDGRAAPINWTYVRGHAGSPGNERVDQIAVSYTKDEDGEPELYDGSRADYTVSLEAPDPAAKRTGGARRTSRKGPAYSYLSEVNGVLKRHRTWPECEKRVKGQSGARFKKALSREDEGDILRGWGHSPSAL